MVTKLHKLCDLFWQILTWLLSNRLHPLTLGYYLYIVCCSLSMFVLELITLWRLPKTPCLCLHRYTAYKKFGCKMQYFKMLEVTKFALSLSLLCNNSYYLCSAWWELVFSWPRAFLCTELISPAAFREALQEGTQNVNMADWRLEWVLRYSIIVKSRGIIKAKGYLVSARKTSP